MGIGRAPWEASNTVTGDQTVCLSAKKSSKIDPKWLKTRAIVEVSVVQTEHHPQADHGSKGGEGTASENWKLFMGVVMLGGDG